MMNFLLWATGSNQNVLFVQESFARVGLCEFFCNGMFSLYSQVCYFLCCGSDYVVCISCFVLWFSPRVSCAPSDFLSLFSSSVTVCPTLMGFTWSSSTCPSSCLSPSTFPLVPHSDLFLVLLVFLDTVVLARLRVLDWHFGFDPSLAYLSFVFRLFHRTFGIQTLPLCFYHWA